MNKDLKDKAAREQIRTLLDLSLFVEAGAGSGKTASLVARMAAMIESGGCAINEMAAITFTRKAAGELRERFQLELEKYFRDENDIDQKELLRGALDHIDQCYIGTIHSFCSAILRERPVEAGLSPDFEEIEGIEERLLEKRAWEEYLLQIKLETPDILNRLQRADLSTEDLFQAYRNLNLYPDVEIAYAAADPPLIDREARSELKKLVVSAAKYLPPFEPQRGWDPLQKKIRMILRRQRIFNLDDDIQFLRLLDDLDRSQAKITLNRWLSNDGARESQSAYEQFKARYLDPILKQWREHRYMISLEFLEPACRYYHDLRARENSLNFQDLLMHCADLLRDNPEVRGYFQNRYRRILIDEFQDTDPIQAQVMLYLTGSDLGERDWAGLSPMPGSLFVVGDPKQSIYRFRRADIDTFEQVRGMIIDSGGLVVSLSSNFRSVPEILDWVNPSFSSLFTAMSAPYQAGYLDMEAVRSSSPGSQKGIWRMMVDDQSKAAGDAAQAAAWIKAAMGGALQLDRSDEEISSGLDSRPVPSDFLILLHYKKDMAEYARALEKAGIDYYAAGANDISSSSYARELLYLLKAVSDPGDPVALVTALRGPFFGVSDQSLYDFKRSGGRFYSLSEIERSPDDGLEALAYAFDALKQYWLWSQQMTASAALERIVESCGVVPMALAKNEGPSQAAGILQVLEIMRLQEQQGNVHFADIIDFLENILEEGLEEEINIAGNRKQGVRLMNLHKAKGLEAPVVILANPWHNSGREPDLHVSRRQGQPCAYFRLTRSSGFTSRTIAQPVSWDSYSAEEARYAQAEKIRLLYVACTRARNLLVIVQNADKPAKSPWSPLDEFLAGAYIADRHPVELPAKTESKSSETLPESRQKRTESITAASALSFRHASVTELVKSGQDEPQRFYTGKGQSWGSAIHKALELLAHDSLLLDKEGWLESILISEGRKTEEKEEARELLAKLLETPLWRRIKNAEQVLTEVPFGSWEQDTYLTGTIDLVFKEAAGWTIIDYKTDAVKDEAHRKQLLDYYQPQVELYKEYWEKISGEKVVGAEILLISSIVVVRDIEFSSS